MPQFQIKQGSINRWERDPATGDLVKRSYVPGDTIEVKSQSHSRQLTGSGHIGLPAPPKGDTDASREPDDSNADMPDMAGVISDDADIEWLTALNQPGQDAVEFVKGLTDTDQLDEAKKAESSRKGQKRRTVLAAIEVRRRQLGQSTANAAAKGATE